MTLIFGTSANAADQAETEAWDAAVATNTAEAFYRYLSLYPAGDYVDDAVRALAGLGAISTRGLDTDAINSGPSGARRSQPAGVYP